MALLHPFRRELAIDRDKIRDGAGHLEADIFVCLRRGPHIKGEWPLSFINPPERLGGSHTIRLWFGSERSGWVYKDWKELSTRSRGRADLTLSAIWLTTSTRSKSTPPSTVRRVRMPR